MDVTTIVNAAAMPPELIGTLFEPDPPAVPVTCTSPPVEVIVPASMVTPRLLSPELVPPVPVTVTVPLPPTGTGSCYARLEYRQQMEIAVVGATAVVTLDGDRVSAAKVAITALAPTIRLTHTIHGLNSTVLMKVWAAAPMTAAGRNAISTPMTKRRALGSENIPVAIASSLVK